MFQPPHDIICLYLTCIRPVLENCASLNRHALPDYLSKDIKHIKKRALSIISPGPSYNDSLSMFNIASLEDRCIENCLILLYLYIISCINFSFPRNVYCLYNFRGQRKFVNPVMRTKRVSSTFLPSMCRR